MERIEVFVLGESKISMKVYRIKHIPSGLYFIPSRKINVKKYDPLLKVMIYDDYVKSNLSKKGKVYNKKPTLKFLGNMYYDHRYLVPKESRLGYLWVDSQLMKVVLSEWVIEEVT